ncbi:TetR/AcrR family transcriptional regulator [Frankia sp. Cas3]|uniref:TetR/AcrR family transcriptional regulator n=1 Tax=Frankia sp. Cas3 TaxID=3073926 RepID=UPI003A100C98
MEAVARRAGVAIGTVYRHFPTRIDLIESIFLDKLRSWVEAGEQALAMPDAWDGFAFCLERLCSLQAHDRGFRAPGNRGRGVAGLGHAPRSVVVGRHPTPPVPSSSASRSTCPSPAP